jgi:predicted nucleic acid-binding protein
MNAAAWLRGFKDCRSALKIAFAIDLARIFSQPDSLLAAHAILYATSLEFQNYRKNGGS